MALTLHLDKTNRAMIVQQGQYTRIVRRGIIKGMTTLGLPAQEIFVQAIAAPGMPPYQDAYPVAPFTNCVLTQRIFEARPGDARKVDVTLIYESWSGMRPVTFVLSRQTAAVNEVTEIDPFTMESLVVTWVNPANPGDVVARVAPCTVNDRVQRLVAEGYFYNGTPPDSMTSAIGTVNNASWRGLPAGHWKYDSQSDVTRDFGNHYHITLELLGRFDRDWSQYKTLRHQNGRYIPVVLSEAQALAAQPYQAGVRHINGMFRFGPYRTASFNTIFGFGNIG